MGNQDQTMLDRKGDISQNNTRSAWTPSFKSKGTSFFNSCQQLFIQHRIWGV